MARLSINGDVELRNTDTLDHVAMLQLLACATDIYSREESQTTMECLVRHSTLSNCFLGCAIMAVSVNECIERLQD